VGTALIARGAMDGAGESMGEILARVWETGKAFVQ
jgi:hypothetical protein